MYNDNYLEKILGEQYNMSNYFDNTYADSEINEIDIPKESTNNEKIDSNKQIKVADKQEDDKVKKNELDDVAKVNNKIQEKEHKEEINTAKDNVEERTFNALQVNAPSVDTKEEKEEIKLEKLYPDIYNVLEPIVEIVVKNHSDKKADNELIKKLTDKIYYAVEATNNDESIQANTIPIGRKHEGKRPKNNLLYDLIKILIINNMVDKKCKCHRI